MTAPEEPGPGRPRIPKGYGIRDAASGAGFVARAANPAMVVHLERGDDVVILEGPAAEGTDPARRAAFGAASRAKYGVRVADVPGDVSVWALTPAVGFAWQERDFPGSATRWVFGERE